MHELRQKQEDPLNLGSLPMVSPAEDGWPDIESALLQTGKRRSLARYAGAALAAAATVALALGLFLGQPGRQATVTDGLAPSELVQNGVENPAITLKSDDKLASLISLSQQLEKGLRLYRTEMGDMPAGALVYQVELEDLVAQVDDQLSMYPDSLGLWSQRVKLMMDLTQLYENSLRREYQQLASL